MQVLFKQENRRNDENDTEYTKRFYVSESTSKEEPYKPDMANGQTTIIKYLHFNFSAEAIAHGSIELFSHISKQHRFELGQAMRCYATIYVGMQSELVGVSYLYHNTLHLHFLSAQSSPLVFLWEWSAPGKGLTIYLAYCVLFVFCICVIPSRMKWNTIEVIVSLTATKWFFEFEQYSSSAFLKTNGKG